MKRLLTAVVLVSALAACSKSTPKEGDQVATTSAKESTKSALVEAFGNGSIAWTIDDSGKIRAEIRDKDGANVSKNASGTIRAASRSRSVAALRCTSRSSAGGRA